MLGFRAYGLIGALLVAPWALCGVAHAQDGESAGEATDDREEEARALFLAGRTAYENGHFEDALERFREAYRLSGRAALLFNIGTTAERLRRDQEAIEAFEQFLAAQPDAENAAQIRARIRILRENAGRSGGGSDDGARIAGGVITGVGLVGLGIGWGFFGDLMGRIDAFRSDSPIAPGFLTRQAAMDDAETAVYATGILAGVVTTVGLPLLLPEESGTPWWSWVIGAVGLGASATGVALLAMDHGCLDQACTRDEPMGALGGLLLGHGVPLLSVPLIYLLREATGSSSVTAQASATAHGAHLTIGGSL
jgi:hypothetical protein